MRISRWKEVQEESRLKHGTSMYNKRIVPTAGGRNPIRRLLWGPFLACESAAGSPPRAGLQVILVEFSKSKVSIASLESGSREEFQPEIAVQELKKKESKEWKIPKRFSHLQRINPFLHSRCLFVDTEIAGRTLGIFLSKYLGGPFLFYRPPIVLSPIGYHLEEMTSYELSEIQKIGKIAGGRNPVIYFGSRITGYDDISSTPEEFWYPGKPKWT